MYCCRVFAFILLLIFTAAAVCSSLFPIFRKGDSENRHNIFYWFDEMHGTNGTITRTYSRNYDCRTERLFFIVTSALSVAGAALGGLSTMLAFAHLVHRPKCCMCSFIMIFTVIACLCYIACTALMVNIYLSGKCKETSYKKDDYKIREGFGLMVAAAGGFLISLFFEACS